MPLLAIDNALEYKDKRKKRRGTFRERNPGMISGVCASALILLNTN